MSARSLWRSAGLVAAVTLLTKVTGFLRVTAITGRLGATSATDAFLTAFLVPETIYLFLTEGAVTAAFVPAFTKALGEGERSYADLAAAAVARTLAVTGALAVVLYLAAGHVAGWVAPGFSTETTERAGRLLALVAAYVPMAAAGAVLSGALNARGQFLVPALGPLTFNLAMIASVWFASPQWVEPLAFGVLAGGALQLALQAAALARGAQRPSGGAAWRAHPGLSEIVALMGPLAFSLGVTQVQLVAERMLASSLPAGAITSLNLIQKLVNLPLGLVGMAVAAPLFPALAKLHLEKDEAGFGRELARGLAGVVALILPLALVCACFSEPVVNLLFVRGAYGGQSAADAARMLFGYAFGLPAVSVGYLLTGAFLAAGDAMGPALLRAALLTGNIALNYAWLPAMGVSGIPAAWSLTWVLNAALLFALAARRFPGLLPGLAGMTRTR